MAPDIKIEPCDTKEINVDVGQLNYLLHGSRYQLSVDQDLDLVRQGIKTRKPVQYGKKVIVRR